MTETPTDWQNVAAALNSQLAAEREVGHNQAVTLGQQIARLEDQLAVERENGHWLGELLAVIHADGGHYQSEHGTKKATADAIKKRNEMVMRVDELETQLAAERDKVRPAIFDPEHYPEDKIAQLEQQLAAERELREQYFDTMERQHKQVQTLVDALKQVREWHDINTHTGQFIDTTLAKIEDQPVQLPMINDDPVVTLK